MWMASPPEVHSGLLSSGPGAGPMLASAAAWKSLSGEYASAAAELAGLVGAVPQVWWGPAEQSYAAANKRYLAWLTQVSADYARQAALVDVVVAAYGAAVAAMPSLVELAANHTVHAVLSGADPNQVVAVEESPKVVVTSVEETLVEGPMVSQTQQPQGSGVVD